MERSTSEDRYEDEGFICPACFIKFDDDDQLFSHYELNHFDASEVSDRNDDELMDVSPSTSDQRERQQSQVIRLEHNYSSHVVI